MKIKCMKCKTQTDTLDGVLAKTKNNRLQARMKCAVCGTVKCLFVKKGTVLPQEVKVGGFLPLKILASLFA